jgi:hypothetical protein
MLHGSDSAQSAVLANDNALSIDRVFVFSLLDLMLCRAPIKASWPIHPRSEFSKIQRFLAKEH